MNNNIDPENEVSYRTSSKGKEVMIVNDREIFHKKYSGKRLINNTFKIGWNCKNKHNCNGTLVSIRDVVDLDGTDYNIMRKNEHSIHFILNVPSTGLYFAKYSIYLFLYFIVVRNLKECVHLFFCC